MMNAHVGFGGSMGAALIPRQGFYAESLTAPIRLPAGLSLAARIRTALLETELRLRLAAKGVARALAKGEGVFGVGRLYASKVGRDGRVTHLGLVSTRVITDAGVAALVDQWDGSGTPPDIADFNYHGCGTGTTAAAQTDTALETETTTELNPNSTRATGTKSQPSANVLRSVGTVTFDGTVAVTEHGLFNQAATGGGILWDRHVFSAINVVSGDSIQFTYDCTVSAGG